MAQYERNNKKWTQEEIDYLYDSWGKFSMNTITKNLKRGESSIRNKITQLGLGSFFENGDYVTMGVLRKALGYSDAHIFTEDWSKWKDLPVKYKTNKEKRLKIIYLEDFWKWAEKNKNLLSFSNFEKYALGPEPKWVDEKRNADIKYNNYRYKKWTERDDQYLISLVNSYKYDYTELAKILGRKEESIKSRIRALGLKARPNKRYIGAWTDNELEIVFDNIKKGNNYEYIQNELGNNRTIKAISGKIFNMFGTQNLNKVRKILNEKVS